MKPQPLFEFDGRTYDHTLDGKRLTGQLQRVYHVMLDGRWHRLAEIAERVEGSEAAVSARLRDLRKQRFGSHIVHHRRVAGGLWEYRLEINRFNTPNKEGTHGTFNC